MASKKHFHGKRASCNNYIFVNPIDGYINPELTSSHDNNLFEFDEADLWNNNNSCSAEIKKMVPSSRNPSKKAGARNMVVESITGSRPVTCAASLPVKIPDWSKIYRNDRYTRHDDHQGQDNDYFDDQSCGGDDEDGRVPPHVYLARRRGASFSVHEGIGRTLKGRDLRQVRNAIWKKVGFED